MMDFVLDFISRHVALTAVVGGSLVFVIFAAVISTLACSLRIYLGVFPMLLGGGALLYLFEQASVLELFIAASGVVVLGGLAYVIGYTLAFASRVHQELGARKERKYRQMEYTLPDRENTYVRTRLENFLNVEDKSGERLWKTEFSYARSLLAKVRSADLSAVDALQAEEMGRLLAMYGKKERLAVEDMSVVNDAFACLLKLAAKYKVNP